MTGRLSDNYFNGLRFPTNPRITSGGRSAVALSSLYSHGSYGTAVAIRYQSQSAAFVDELYVFMDVVAGTLANIQLTCGPCNNRKRATDPIEFAQRLGRLI